MSTSNWVIIGGENNGAPIADAPNITSATATVAYNQVGNGSVIDISGVITLPTAALNYVDLQSITISYQPSGATTWTPFPTTLNAPWPESGTINYDSGSLTQPSSAQTWTLQFVCTSTNGAITPDPYTTTISLNGLSVLGVTGGDASALNPTDPKYLARTSDKTGAPHFQIWFQPSFPPGQSFPVTVSIYYNPGTVATSTSTVGQYSPGWHFMTAVKVTSSSETFSSSSFYVPSLASQNYQLGILPPTSSGFIDTPGPAEPANLVLGSTFTVNPIGTIPSNDLGLSLIENGSGSLYDYAGPFPPGFYTYCFHDMQITFPASDVNLYDIRVTVQQYDTTTGNPTPDIYGTERCFWTADGTGGVPDANVQALMTANGGPGTFLLMGPHVIDSIPDTSQQGQSVPSFGIPPPNCVHRLRVYGASRLATPQLQGNPIGYSGTPYGGGTPTLQAGWPGGATYYDMNPGAAPPTKALDLTQSLASSIGTSLGLDPTSGALTVTTISADQILSVNASTINGTITASQIGSVNASTINGTLTSSQINTITAGQITGQLTATQIATVNATSINGTLSATQIATVNATSIQGLIQATQINTLSTSQLTGTLVASQIASVAATTITGSITSGQIGSVNTSSFVGVIVSAQLESQIINSVNLINTGILTNGIASNGSQLGINTAGMTTGTWTASQISSVNATTIVGLITAAQINSIAATQITGTIQASQIAAVNATSITGTISSGQIGSINAATITIGLIQSTQINTVNVSKLTAGSATFSGTASFISGTSTLTLTSTGITLSSSTVSIAISDSGSYPGLVVTGSTGTSTVIEGSTVACGSITAASLAVTPGTVQVSSGSTISTLAYNSLTIAGVTCINSSGVFVGNGMVCAGSGIECAGVNVYNSGTLYFGYTGQVKVSTTSSGGYYLFSTGVNYMDFRGGVLCTS